MVRTQIYLTKEEKAEIKKIAKLSGKSQSDVIREALDQYINKVKPDNWKEKISTARGIWKDREDLPDFDKIRKEMDRQI
jgi:metal-responsive CopG/Arc/MetJ family transcriptional regulator